MTRNERCSPGSVLDASMPVPPFEVDNRGKRSVVLDLRDRADRATFEDLLATADVFVTNMRPGALDRLDLGPEAVAPATRGSCTARSLATAPTARTVIERATTSVRTGRGLASPTRSFRPASSRPGRGRGRATIRPA